MKKNVIFYFLAILTLLFFINSLFMCVQKGAKPKVFSPVYNIANIIIEAKPEHNDDILINLNEEYFLINGYKNILNKTIKDNIKSINILVKKGQEDKIERVVFFNDIKTSYFKDISSFEKEDFTLCKNQNCTNYTKYKLPEEIKYNKNSNSYNFHSVQNTICVLILYCISGSFLFFIPYIMLFITLVYFINNKKEIKTFKINIGLLSILAFILLILMYSNNLLDCLPWTDEYRTIEYSNPNFPISTIFKDPGNPPVFYFLFRFFIKLFKISTFTMKIFPFIISVFAGIFIFMFLKKRYSLKMATIGLFLASVNIPLIYYAQETRSYILQALLTPFIVYFLFKILEENKKKYYLIYAALVALSSNIHYYEILLLFSNFIYAFLYLLSKKRYKDILKFICANVVGLIFFLPFFIMTAFNDALMDSSFNTWIPDINYNQIKKCVFYIFGGGASFILSIFFFVKELFKKEKNGLVIYSFFAIAFTILQGIILSYAIRPMLIERYLVLLAPLFVIFLVSVLVSYRAKKYIAILFIIWLLFIQNGSFEQNNRSKGIIEMPLSFSKQYLKTKKPENNVYAIINLANPDYLENRESLMDDNINYIASSIYSVEEIMDNILKKDKNAIIFTSVYNPDPNNPEEPEKYNHKCFYNSSVDMRFFEISN